jgi:penicillin-binding protein 2
VLGRQLNKHQEEQPRAGEDITLSLDIDLQQAASDALGEESGAVVVMEPDSGKLRALVTHPSYDNNMFTATLPKKDWAALVEDPRHPLQNRAIQSVYPPGSVWKLMMASLLLEQKVDPRATISCGGQVTLGSHTFRCWKRDGHGPMNLMQSLINSCDVYYYEMGQRAGIDNIERFARLCGFGSPTGIDLPHERSGLVPGRQWKRNRFGEPWQGGETLNVSIGQGYTLVTPLQMAVFVSALLNEGKLLKPSLIENEEPEVRSVLPMPASHRNFILEAMRITASSGTARRISRPDAIMGGKTGTAQVVRIGERRLKKHEMSYRHRDHAWLTSWGMKDGKTYVVVVMVEHGGGGSSTAGPIVAKVFEALFGPVVQGGPPPGPSPFADPTGVPRRRE